MRKVNAASVMLVLRRPGSKKSAAAACSSKNLTALRMYATGCHGVDDSLKSVNCGDVDLDFVTEVLEVRMGVLLFRFRFVTGLLEFN
jgi:hypothetical protein